MAGTIIDFIGSPSFSPFLAAKVQREFFLICWRALDSRGALCRAYETKADRKSPKRGNKQNQLGGIINNQEQQSGRAF
jgi:hypothetical protein